MIQNKSSEIHIFCPKLEADIPNIPKTIDKCVMENLHKDICTIGRLSQFSPTPAMLWTNLESLNFFTPSSYSLLLTAVQDLKTIGFVLARVIMDELELDYIAVLPTKRSQGLGLILMEHLIDISRKNRIKRILLEVECNNLSAQVLYCKCEFAYIGRRKKYYSGITDALIMEKVL